MGHLMDIEPELRPDPCQPHEGGCSEHRAPIIHLEKCVVGLAYTDPRHVLVDLGTEPDQSTVKAIAAILEAVEKFSGSE